MNSTNRFLPKDLGLKGLYTWSAPGKSYTEDELMAIVLPRAHYSDVLRLCVRFGIDKVKRNTQILQLSPSRLERLLKDIRIIEELSEQAKLRLL